MAIAAIANGEDEAYVRSSNYFDAQGRITPAGRLSHVPADWDYDGNGK